MLSRAERLKMRIETIDPVLVSRRGKTTIVVVDTVDDRMVVLARPSSVVAVSSATGQGTVLRNGKLGVLTNAATAAARATSLVEAPSGSRDRARAVPGTEAPLAGRTAKSPGSARFNAIGRVEGDFVVAKGSWAVGYSMSGQCVPGNAQSEASDASAQRKVAAQRVASIDITYQGHDGWKMLVIDLIGRSPPAALHDEAARPTTRPVLTLRDKEMSAVDGLLLYGPPSSPTAVIVDRTGLNESAARVTAGSLQRYHSTQASKTAVCNLLVSSFNAKTCERDDGRQTADQALEHRRVELARQVPPTARQGLGPKLADASEGVRDASASTPRRKVDAAT